MTTLQTPEERDHTYLQALLHEYPLCVYQVLSIDVVQRTWCLNRDREQLQVNIRDIFLRTTNSLNLKKDRGGT